MSRKKNATAGLVLGLTGIVLGGLGAYAASLYLGNDAAQRAGKCADGSSPFCEDAEYQAVMGAGVLGLILLGLAVVFWVKFFREGRQIERIQEAGVEVEATIVNVERSNTRSHGVWLFHHDIEFDSPVGPVRFRHQDTQMGYAGDKVMVKYDPDNPHSARVSQVWLRSGHARAAHREKYGFLGETEVLGMKVPLADLVPRRDPQSGPTDPNPANPTMDEFYRDLSARLSRGEITRDQYKAEAEAYVRSQSGG